MTIPTNWPNPERPGVPMFPERDGWHAIGLTIKQVKWWDAANKYWWDSERRYYLTLDEVAYRVPEYRYDGPILTPTQIAEMLAGERERCANVCKTMIVCDENQYGVGLKTTSAEARIKALAEAQRLIRNLGDAP